MSINRVSTVLQNICTWYHKPEDHSMNPVRSFLSSQRRSQRDPYRNEMVFCEIVVPVEISIPATFHCFLATRILRADIQSCQEAHFWAQVLLLKLA
jgi:hypothetical protein